MNFAGIYYNKRGKKPLIFKAVLEGVASCTVGRKFFNFEVVGLDAMHSISRNYA